MSICGCREASWPIPSSHKDKRVDNERCEAETIDHDKESVGGVHPYVGGRSPGESSQSVRCEAVSSCLALRSNSSRLTLERSFLACSRSRIASAASRCSRDDVWGVRRRLNVVLLPVRVGRERNRRSRSPIVATSHGSRGYTQPVLIGSPIRFLASNPSGGPLQCDP